MQHTPASTSGYPEGKWSKSAGAQDPDIVGPQISMLSLTRRDFTINVAAASAASTEHDFLQVKSMSTPVPELNAAVKALEEQVQSRRVFSLIAIQYDVTVLSTLSTLMVRIGQELEECTLRQFQHVAGPCREFFEELLKDTTEITYFGSRFYSLGLPCSDLDVCFLRGTGGPVESTLRGPRSVYI